uniref:Uncharacterized protein n=1 Tax=Lepeophtheirus salmonis TaxID=72036 RepID=A0A0K2TJY3_LEPSM
MLEITKPSLDLITVVIPSKIYDEIKMD